MNNALEDLARRYTAAWCSQNPASVASFYSSDGSLTINGGVPSYGRAAITLAASSFMQAFPDLKVIFDKLTVENGLPRYHWTLRGTYAQTGRAVCISALRNGHSALTA